MGRDEEPPDDLSGARYRASIVDLTWADGELKALVAAAAEGNRRAMATRRAAEFVKVLTGSSVAAGAAEKIASPFRLWLTDNREARLQEAAREYACMDAADRQRESLFAQVRTLLVHGLRCTEAALTRLEQGQAALGRLVLARSADLEELLYQVLRSFVGLCSCGRPE